MNANIFKYFTIWRWDMIVSFPSIFGIERFILIVVLWIDIGVMTWPRIRLFSLICHPLTPYSHNHYITSTILLGVRFAQINSAGAETAYVLEIGISVILSLSIVSKFIHTFTLFVSEEMDNLTVKILSDWL